MKQSTINLLTSIKNHSTLKKEALKQKFYFKSIEIIKLLYKEGFIQSFSIINQKTSTKTLKLLLRFFFNNSLINKILFFSKSSKKIFVKYKQLVKLSKHKNGLLIVSTSKGILTSYECIKKKIGGLLLFSIK